MRFAALLAVLMASTLGLNAANVTFNFVNLTNYPGRSMVVKLTPQPTNAPGLSSGGIVLRDTLKYSTDTNGALTVTNLAPWRYLVEATGPYAVTAFQITAPDTSDTVYATNHFSVGIATNGTTSAYSQSVSDARFYPRTSNPSNYVTTAVTDALALAYTNSAELHVDKGGSDSTGRRGRSDKPFLTITAAKTAAQAGDSIIVHPGNYTNQNNLLKAGVNYYGMPGANVFYLQTTTTDAGWGLFDDRTSGAYTNTIVWEGTLEFYGVTNMLLSVEEGTYDFNTNTHGMFVFTNANSAPVIKANIVKCSAVSQSSGGGNTAAFYIANCSRAMITVDQIIDPFINVIFDDGLITYNSQSSGLTWFLGDIHFNARLIDTQRTYAWWGAEPSGNHTNDIYATGDLWKATVYVDCHSPNYRSWTDIKEIQVAGGVGTGVPLAFYGGGKHYVRGEKALSESSYCLGLNEAAAGANTNVQVWVNFQKFTGSIGWMDLRAGSAWVNVEHFEDGGGLWDSGIIVRTNANLRLTGQSAAASGKVLDFRGGKAVVQGLELRSTNNVAVHVTNPGLLLQNTLLISKSTSNSIYATTAQTVGVLNVAANTTNSASVTRSPNVFTIDAAIQ